ncbi:hypothetical protein H0H92_010394 [Tricholoma furcatifolium]|nr:hypothetical protein H0H92_010394 [Tricholoma furcatifolium]
MIYCHDISASSGWSGPTKYNFDILRQLCGPAAASRTVILTTKWNYDDTDAVKQLAFREDTLKATHWSQLLTTGAAVHRMHCVKENAQDTVVHLLSQSSSPSRSDVVMSIQTELVEANTRIPETSAARELMDNLSLELQHRLASAGNGAASEDTIFGIEKEFEMLGMQFGMTAKTKLDQYRRLMSRLRADKAKAAMFRASGRSGPTKSNEIRLKELRRIEKRIERLQQEMNGLRIPHFVRLKMFVNDLPQRILQKFYFMVYAN